MSGDWLGVSGDWWLGFLMGVISAVLGAMLERNTR